MNDTKSAELRLPVQAAVDRTATYATLADGTGVETSGIDLSHVDWPGVLQTIAGWF